MFSESREILRYTYNREVIPSHALLPERYVNWLKFLFRSMPDNNSYYGMSEQKHHHLR